MTFPSVPRDPVRTPIFNVPVIIVVTVAVLVIVHVARRALSDQTDLILLRDLAFVPARIWLVLDPGRIAAQLSGGPSEAQAGRAELAQFFLGQGDLKPWTILTYGLLHANFTHLAMNLLWLVAFGAPVARRFGAIRFIGFLVVASAAGAVAHTLAHPYDVAPIIGASAAVSGVVAAALRFVFQPGESLAPSRRRDGEAAIAGVPAPALPLRQLWRERRAVSFLAVWFVVNFLFGMFAVPLGVSDQSVAWEAHIGGLLAGLFLFSAFDPPRPRRR